MRVLFNRWEKWITTTGSDIKIGDGSKKTFKTVMGTWRENSSQTSKMQEKQDDEETGGLEGGYSSNRGRSRHCLDYHIYKLRENSSAESEGGQEEEGKTLMGTMKEVHHCLREQKRGVAKRTVMMC
jgi:hypothetical protein